MLHFQKENQCPKWFLMIKCAMDHKKESQFFNLRVLSHQSVVLVHLGEDLHLGGPVSSHFLNPSGSPRRS